MNRIEDNRDAIRLFSASCLVLSVSCLAASLRGGIPMPVETHGSAMYIIPAEMWSLAVTAQAVLVLWGSHRRRMIPLMAGGFLGAGVYGFLAWLAEESVFGFFLWKGMAIFAFIYLVIGCGAVLQRLGLYLLREPSVLRALANWITGLLVAFLALMAFTSGGVVALIAFLASTAFYSRGLFHAGP